MTDAQARAGGEGPADPVESATRRYPGRFLAAVAVVIALDQLTKAWALVALDDGPVDLVGSLRLRIVLNDGAAFSMVSGRTTMVALVAALITAGVAWLGLRADRASWALGFGIIVGGAGGNLVDRAFRSGDGFLGGRVVDFVDLQWWPVFNLADSAIFVGVGLMLLLSLRDGAEPADDHGAADGAPPDDAGHDGGHDLGGPPDDAGHDAGHDRHGSPPDDAGHDAGHDRHGSPPDDAGHDGGHDLVGPPDDAGHDGGHDLGGPAEDAGHDRHGAAGDGGHERGHDGGPAPLR